MKVRAAHDDPTPRFAVDASAGRRHKCDIALESFMERFIASPVESSPAPALPYPCLQLVVVVAKHGEEGKW